VGADLTDVELLSVFEQIGKIDADDGITYITLGISDIAAELKYGGKSIKIEARLKNLKRVFSVDIAQCDVVTPYPQKYIYKSIVDNSEFELLAYNAETIIAEKFETLIAKGMGNSRAKDLFDIHILLRQGVDVDKLNAALINTFYVRGTRFDKKDIQSTLDAIYASSYRREVFDNYAKKHSFANGVTFDEVMQSVYYVYNNIKTCDEKLPESFAKVSLVRHGEDERDKVGGWSDNNLTQNGIKQVGQFASSLTDKYDLIIASDLPRARQTAEIIADKLRCEVVYDEGLRETNNGDLKNLTKAEFHASGYKRFADMQMDESYPNGESPSAFYVRVKSAFIRILKKYDGKKILLVTHGGVITVILCIANGWQYSNMLKIIPPYASKIDITN
ncbi:MAG: nucleotidyl transferase AbiEii/AbiGii toxin family protein, partial [Corallococcus sp.]|nr:nucleotidyl transferase AbiEii/AbiGii toxin family protein [Corallococcus sp.]